MGKKCTDGRNLSLWWGKSFFCENWQNFYGDLDSTGAIGFRRSSSNRPIKWSFFLDLDSNHLTEAAECIRMCAWCGGVPNDASCNIQFISSPVTNGGWLMNLWCIIWLSLTSRGRGLAKHAPIGAFSKVVTVKPLVSSSSRDPISIHLRDTARWTCVFVRFFTAGMCKFCLFSFSFVRIMADRTRWFISQYRSRVKKLDHVMMNLWEVPLYFGSVLWNESSIWTIQPY